MKIADVSWISDSDENEVLIAGGSLHTSDIKYITDVKRKQQLQFITCTMKDAELTRLAQFRMLCQNEPRYREVVLHKYSLIRSFLKGNDNYIEKCPSPFSEILQLKDLKGPLPNGLYFRPGDAGATTIWYKYDKEWYWTPMHDLSFWLPVTITTVPNAPFKREKPADSNKIIIMYLAANQPRPNK